MRWEGEGGGYDRMLSVIALVMCVLGLLVR